MRYYDLKCKKIIDSSEHAKIQAKLITHWEDAGKRLEADENNVLTTPKSPNIIRCFRNSRVHLELEWLGSVSDDQVSSLFVSDYPLYKLSYYDHDYNGNLKDKATEVKTFSKYAKAASSYENAVVEYAKDSYFDDDMGEIVTPDNEMYEHALIMLVESAEATDGKPKAVEIKPKSVIDEDSELFGW